jgi:putative ABC transport system substrate-binding protein
MAMPVIGFLSTTSPEPNADIVHAFRRGLKDTGYVEGENIAIEYRWGEVRPDRLPALAAELVRRNVNVLAVLSAPASLAAAKATTTIPTVFMVPEDPVRLGLVTSLSRPGGNRTGVNFFSVELAAKRLDLLRMLVPAAKRVAVLLNPAEPTIAAANLRDVEAAASAMGLQIRVLNASTSAEIDAAFATFVSERPDALFISSGPFFTSRRVQLAHLATRYGIPASAASRPYTQVGGLMSYGTSQTDTHRQAAFYVARLLKGEKPGDLPVVQSTKFEFVINLQTARLLGIEVPESLLATRMEGARDRRGHDWRRQSWSTAPWLAPDRGSRRGGGAADRSRPAMTRRAPGDQHLVDGRRVRRVRVPADHIGLSFSQPIFGDFLPQGTARGRQMNTGYMRFLGFILTAFLVSACSDLTINSDFRESVGTPTELRLAAGDKLRVTVFGEDRLSSEYQIDNSGAISLPLAGTIKAGGLTKPQLEDAITSQLKAQYLRNPKVTVDVVTCRPFYVLGEVQKPGEYPFRSGLNVLSAIAMPGAPPIAPTPRR